MFGCHLHLCTTLLDNSDKKSKSRHWSMSIIHMSAPANMMLNNSNHGSEAQRAILHTSRRAPKNKPPPLEQRNRWLTRTNEACRGACFALDISLPRHTLAWHRSYVQFCLHTRCQVTHWPQALGAYKAPTPNIYWYNYKQINYNYFNYFRGKTSTNTKNNFLHFIHF